MESAIAQRMTIVAGFGAEGVGQGDAGQGPILAGIAGKARNWPVTAASNSYSSSQPAAASFRSSWQSQIASLASVTSAHVDSGVSSETSSASAKLIAEESADESLAPSSNLARSSALRMELVNDQGGGRDTSATVPGQTGIPKPISALRTSIVRVQPVAVRGTVKIHQNSRPSASTSANKPIDHQRTTHKSLYSDASLNAGLPPTEGVGSSRVDLQACKLEYSIVSPK